MVTHHYVVDGRLRFLNRFSGLVNRDLVLLGRFRVLGQIKFLDGVVHLHDISDDLATSDLAVTQDQLLDILSHQIQRLDHFERVVAEFSCGTSCGTSCWFLNVFLSPSSVVASLTCGLDEAAPPPCNCSTK